MNGAIVAGDTERITRTVVVNNCLSREAVSSNLIDFGINDPCTCVGLVVAPTKSTIASTLVNLSCSRLCVVRWFANSLSHPNCSCAPALPHRPAHNADSTRTHVGPGGAEIPNPDGIFYSAFVQRLCSVCAAFVQRLCCV